MKKPLLVVLLTTLLQAQDAGTLVSITAPLSITDTDEIRAGQILAEQFCSPTSTWISTGVPARWYLIVHNVAAVPHIPFRVRGRRNLTGPNLAIRLLGRFSSTMVRWCRLSVRACSPAEISRSGGPGFPVPHLSGLLLGNTLQFFLQQLGSILKSSRDKQHPDAGFPQLTLATARSAE